MSVSEMQACLARLYVDDSFRKLFYLAPDETAQGYRLTAEESLALKQIDRRMLDFFSRSLKNKRKELLEPAYPLLFKITGNAIGHYFRRYCQLHIRTPYQPDHQDILSFGTFMEESMTGSDDVPAFASEVARYERLSYWTNFCPVTQAGTYLRAPGAPEVPEMEDRLQVQNDIRMECFSYDVFALREKVDSGAELNGSTAIEKGDYYVLFKPVSPPFEARMLRINSATRELLNTCDGVKTVAEIIASVERRFEATDCSALYWPR